MYEYEYMYIVIDNYFTTLPKYTNIQFQIYLFISTVDKRNVYIISMGAMLCGNNSRPGLGAVGSYVKR